MREEALGSKISRSLAFVRELASRLARIFDAYALINALQVLADNAREQADPASSRYEAILRHCRQLVDSPASLAEVVIRLLGNKDDIEVSSLVHKVTSANSNPAGNWPPHPYLPLPMAPQQFQRPGFGRGNGPPANRLQNVRCYKCGRFGHYARRCYSKQA